MEEGSESRKRNSNGKPLGRRFHKRKKATQQDHSNGKPLGRRFHKRKKATQQDHSSINIAQARTEIVSAFHLHRSSSSSCDYGSQYCSSLLESLPLPQPTWSTTPPSVVATPPPPPPPPMEALEFEWVENLASSYTWWLGFLKTLDGNNNTAQVVSKYPFEEDIVMGMGYGLKIGDPLPCLDGNDDHQSSSLDEWLTIPTVEDQGEMMM
ncbi:hypothetical protein LOK49_LG10G02389 [Camellia lanceoleosa]|uniref:Uncharacterized protein n=1 Tax=Camellia lanceoleosa TaxID=1840588 RepID=A0ACC0GC21_9ERIC|nr:hypothetical protein LOK49_LG10G02389 [Camellia lanceoleosa]